jgi:exopolysaccharide biosynthesis polyprenyl glycosylphosphotransferase
VQFKLVPDLFEMSLDQVQVNEVNGVPLLGVKSSAISGWDFVLKRAVDIGLAATALLVGAPLFGLIALLIRLDSPGPVIFRQVRVGRNGRHFICYKFRSMYQDAEQRLAELRERSDADGPLFKMRSDPRRTRVGTLLRRTSLDELPQVFNILKGDMSWVGPRPAVPSEVELYEAWHRQRLAVTPGLTGLWQVSGRSDLTFDEMVLLDLYYAEHWSLWLDLKIMLRTVPAVVLARGAY